MTELLFGNNSHHPFQLFLFLFQQLSFLCSVLSRFFSSHLSCSCPVVHSSIFACCRLSAMLLLDKCVLLQFSILAVYQGAQGGWHQGWCQHTLSWGRASSGALSCRQLSTCLFPACRLNECFATRAFQLHTLPSAITERAVGSGDGRENGQCAGSGVEQVVG